MSEFTRNDLSTETLWRSIILMGRNVASYKFALGKALLEIAKSGKGPAVRLEDLAEPFSRNIIEHLALSETQGTSPSSKFLNVCRRYQKQEADREELIAQTVRLGFVNVIDAFHVVNQGDVAVRFFEDARKSGSGAEGPKIVLTDELYALVQSELGLNGEAEARWRLVETAWSLGLSPNLLEVQHTHEGELLFVETPEKGRITITSSRDALNGYQKGKCFFCFGAISVISGAENLCDVDHFFPHTLGRDGHVATNIDGIWNLVLACRGCNRGVGGKFALLPNIRLLERLHRRNNYLIESCLPLRETLQNQTGYLLEARREFLQNTFNTAKKVLITEWEPQSEIDREF